MRKQLSRRRVKKRRRPNENSKMKFTVVLVIMIIAVALGYLTARFVIGPLLGYNTDESRVQIAGQQSEAGSSEKNTKDDKEEESSVEDSSAETTEKTDSTSEETGSDDLSPVPDSGYALQFGVFSTKEAAQKMVNDLAQKGVETKIIQEGETYKVISPIINTKEEAIGKIDEIKDKEVEDVFIASF